MVALWRERNKFRREHSRKRGRMKDFKDKTAVITGGASGIGLAFARCFGREGCRLVLADVEAPALHAAVQQLRAEGLDAVGRVADVARYEDVEALAAFAAERFGKTHLLFNNAGVSITGPTWALGEDDWRWVWGVNVWGVVNGIRAFVPGMMAHREPSHVINTGSLASFNGNGDHAPYCSSKAAVLGVSQSLYSEMRATMTAIGVSIVCPGMVATRIHQSWRNRPEADKPWSDREYADAAFRAGSEEFQGRGISPDVIAEATLDAVKSERFYVFAGPNWRMFLETALGRAMRAENPFVSTWGEDCRPPSERPRPPWSSV